tara:strand:- start:16 stop:486 length:471 start_codon:yes stop_codon:yes gene_type:complete
MGEMMSKPAVLTQSPLLAFLLFVLTLPGCSDGGNRDYIGELETDLVGNNVLEIERSVFSQEDEDVWQLSLVGNHELITQDLCGKIYNCDYSTDDFQKLIEGNSYFDRLDDNTKKLIVESNEYFGASNVVVYDHNNLELYTDLNSLDPPPCQDRCRA